MKTDMSRNEPRQGSKGTIGFLATLSVQQICFKSSKSSITSKSPAKPLLHIPLRSRNINTRALAVRVVRKLCFRTHSKGVKPQKAVRIPLSQSISRGRGERRGALRDIFYPPFSTRRRLSSCFGIPNRALRHKASKLW